MNHAGDCSLHHLDLGIPSLNLNHLYGQDSCKKGESLR